jgi:hypothetical protein
MPVSFLLQLVPDALAQSRIVGQAKDIETGVTVRLRNTDDLLSFLFSCSECQNTTTGDVRGQDEKGRLVSRQNRDGRPE